MTYLKNIDKLISKKKIEKLCKKYNILVLILFGSRANNTFTKHSDWDLAFYSKYELTPEKEIDFKYSLIEIINNDNIDIVNINLESNNVLRKEIFFNGICLFEARKDLFEIFKDKIFFEYQDYQPFLELKKKELFKI